MPHGLIVEIFTFFYLFTLAFSIDTNIWPEKQTVPIHGGASIYCSSYGKLPVWYFNGRRLAATHTRVVIQRANLDHAGIYACKGWTIDQRSFRATSTLIVESIKDPGIYPPGVDMVLGGMMVFNCVYDGYVSWQFNGGQVPQSSELLHSHILLVKDLIMEDEGTFSCTHRESQFEALSEIRMFDPMKIRPYKIILYPGEDAMFKCISDTNLVSWYHNDRKLRDEFKELSLYEVSDRHDGYYDCIGEKQDQKFRTRGVLLVMRRTKEKVFPHEVSKREGGSVRFDCRHGSHVTWKFQRGRLPPNARVERDPIAEKSVLVIENITKGNQGHYQCEGEESEEAQSGFYDEGLLLLAASIDIPGQKPRLPPTRSQMKHWKKIKRLFSRHRTI